MIEFQCEITLHEIVYQFISKLNKIYIGTKL